MPVTVTVLPFVTVAPADGDVIVEVGACSRWRVRQASGRIPGLPGLVGGHEHDVRMTRIIRYHERDLVRAGSDIGPVDARE